MRISRNFWAPYRVFDSIGLGWGSKISFSYKCSGEANVALLDYKALKVIKQKFREGKDRSRLGRESLRIIEF